MGKVSRALNKAESPGREESTTIDIPTTGADSYHAYSSDEIEPQETDALQPAPTDSVLELGSWDERLISASENFSGVAEGFRKLRTLIMHPDTGNPPRSIMVLSTDPQEGKSFVCANLGITMARGVGQKGLMIDCDMRRPSLHSLFGLNNTRGLADYLQSDENPASYILPTGLPKLSLMPSGPPPINPAELISSTRMPAMILDLANRDKDCLLLLDSPPFLAAAETVVLSQLVDKVVLVVRWGGAGRENIKKVVEQIGREKIIGVVFNAFEMNILDKKVQGVGYHNYYSEMYYQ